MKTAQPHAELQCPNRARHGAPENHETTAGDAAVAGAAFHCPHCGGSVPEAAKALEKAERFMRRLFSRQEEFEQSLAAAIYDDLAQQLSGALLYLEGCGQLHDMFKNGSRESFQIGLSLLQDGIREARRIAAELQPLMCADHGVTLGIECLIHEARSRPGPNIEFHVQGNIGRLDSELERAVYRIVRELLSNACRHSGSEKVRVTLARAGDRLRIEVQDWGVGFNGSKEKSRGFGLQEVGQRSRLLGGQMIVDSCPDEGTRVAVHFPIQCR